MAVDEYRERIRETQNGGANEDERELVWMEFREKLDKALEKRDLPVDMGMDLGG